MTKERSLPDLLRAAERRVNAFVFNQAYPEFCRIPADRDHDLDLLLVEAADEIERLTRERDEWRRGSATVNERLMAEIERLQQAMAAADRLAHEFTYRPAHARYWAAREKVGRCTVCNDEGDDLTHSYALKPGAKP